MKDKYTDFNKLRISEKPEKYRIDYSVLKNSFLIFTPHGGGIEPGTSEICRKIHSNIYSYYLFEGKGQNCKRLHLTSTNFNEPTLIKIIKTHDYAVSIHGMEDKIKEKVGADIYIGGLNQELIELTTKNLRSKNFSAINNIQFPNYPLAGKDVLNITNKCRTNRGMQIEISESLRSNFFAGNFRVKSGRKKFTNSFNIFCDLITYSINTFEETAL